MTRNLTTLDRIGALNARLNGPPLDGHAELGESLASLLAPLLPVLREWLEARDAWGDGANDEIVPRVQAADNALLIAITRGPKGGG